jgi:heme-degrading monooxygenase HmoA
MFVILWEFEVKPGCEERFEDVYGPDGDWARLFRTDADYIETRLLRDPSRSSLYLTLDIWKTRTAYENFLRGRKGEYQNLDAATGNMTARERRIGMFEEAEAR